MTRKITVYCDRCGDQVEDPHPVKKAVFRIFKTFQIFHFLLEKTHPEVHLELCSPCYQKILEFVKEK